MPTASEKVPNRALSTSELRTLLERDFARLCDNFSLLQSCSSFSRIAWTLRLTLYTDQGPQDITLDSRAEGKNITMRKPELTVVGDAPVDAALRQLGVSRELRRDVDSPNAERLRAGLPVPIERRQADSTVVTEMVKYPPDESLGEGAVQMTDPDAPAESAEEMKARISREAAEIIEAMKPPAPAPPDAALPAAVEEDGA